MKHLIRLTVILLVSLIGEVLQAWIPLPVPAGIYGMVLLFVLLCTGVVRLETVHTVGTFLIEIMPVMFIPAVVGVLDSWDTLRSMLLPAVIALLPVTWIVMAAAGHTTQALIRGKRRNGDEPK